METLIKKVGRIHYHSSLQDGSGIRIAKVFLTSVVEEFAKQASRYIRKTLEAPFVFKERQLHSILAPAISKLTDEFMMEVPVKRQWSAISSKDYEDSHGWVDYWCHYRNTVFLIELKHNFISTRIGQANKRTEENWLNAIRQLDVVELTAQEMGEYCKGTFRVAMHILPLFETANAREPRFLGDKDLLVRIQKSVFQDLEAKPNWSALWMLHGELSGPYEYANTVEYYPGVLFVCKVCEVCK